MKVRPATETDIQPCLRLAEQFWHESIYKMVSFDADKSVAYGRNVIENPWSLFWVAEDGGGVIGFVIAHLENPAFSNDIMAVHDFLFVNKDDRGHMAGIQLMRVYDHWAKENGAVIATFVPSGMGLDPRWESFANHLGFEKTGLYFRKEM